MTGPSNQDDDRGGLPRDLTKKILTLGLGAYFLTEDTVRRYVKEAKIPRDLGKVITQNASKGKEELYGFVARELSDFLKQMDLQEELDRFVRNHKIRISAEIEFLPRSAVDAGAPKDEEGEQSEDDPVQSESPIDWNVKFRTNVAQDASTEEAALD